MNFYRAIRILILTNIFHGQEVLYLIYFLDDEVCFDVKISTAQYGSDLEWRLGTCNSIGILYPTKIYIHRCCLKPGRHTLTCINRRNPFGWDGGYIEIQGHRYCDDFMAYRLMQTINIKGIIYDSYIVVRA